MKILIVYATNSGSTFLAAQHLQSTAQGLGHEVMLQEIKSTDPSVFNQHDIVLWGSPSWDDNGAEGQPHQDFLDFMKEQQEIDLSAVKIAVFGLGDKSYHYFCGAVDHLEKFITDHQGKILTPSVRIDRFFNDQQACMQQLADWLNNVITAVQA